MPIVTLSNIEKSFGQRVIFDKLEFMIDRGERVGLIGDNGQGKTTLFKIITGDVKPESGIVAIAKTVKIGYLAQDASFDEKNTVMDEAELAFAELHDLAHRMRELEHDMAEHADEDLEKTLKTYEKVQHDFDVAGGYAWQHRLEATLLGVGLVRESWEQPVVTLSGGQRSRLALAKLLISEPDVLLLDEPTNHLDLAAIDWLENYLLEFTGAVLLISHDRYLLDRLATRIVWLTRAQLNSYPGNYSAFVTQRELQELSQQRQYELQQADIEKQKEYIRRFGAGQRSKEAKGREKRLDRLLKSGDVIQSVTVTRDINLNLHTGQRAGDQVLQVRDLVKKFGDRTLWGDVKFDIIRGDRVGIIGPNGSGKTTLLKVLLGDEPNDSGTIKWGASLKTAYYDQRLDEFDPEKSVLEQVQTGRIVKEKLCRDMLGAMLFRGDDVDKKMGLLSGGERARVALTQMLIDGPNVLILDEPTNHLDVRSCDALEAALADFPGTIFCVSHDRYFLEQVCDRMLVIDPPTVIDFDGGFAEWVRKSAEKKSAAAAAAKADKKQETRKAEKPKQVEKPKQPQNQQNQNQQKQGAKKDNPYSRPFGTLSMDELERQIGVTESGIAATQQRFSDPALARDASKAKQVQAEHDQLASKLKALEAEYYTRGK